MKKILLMTIVSLFLIVTKVNADLIAPIEMPYIPGESMQESYALQIVICIGIAVAIALIAIFSIKAINKKKNK